MSKDQNSYKQIMKATSLFGGVQVVNILVQIVRSKAIAILLGPSGIGLLGLFNTTLLVVGNLSNFGLGISGVKDISQANTAENQHQISKTATILRRLVWFTGVLGAVILFVAAPLLSKLVFSSSEYTYAFMWLSVSLLLTQLTSGQLVILQGLRKLKYLAQASIFGNILALILSLPLYYFFGTEGIVPALIITAIVTLLFSWFYANKIDISPIQISIKEIISEGGNMLRMGFMISISGLLTVGVFYLVQIFVRNIGGVEQVGLYVAGFVIINNYVGLIFNAMATDYYPRLAGLVDDTPRCNDAVNQQAEIAILILAPILLIFLTFVSLGILILYSEEFLGIKEMLYCAVVGIMFKATSWCLAFIFLAKGASKMFFWNELLVNVYMLTFNIAGYYYYGLVGLGLAFTISYFLYMIQVFIIVKTQFQFLFERGFVRIFIIQLIFVLLGFSSAYFIDSNLRYILGVLLIACSSYYSFKILDNRMNFKLLFKKFRK